MTFSVRLSENESKLIKEYAAMNGMTVSDVIRKAVLEQIEDEHDLAAYKKAMGEYQKDKKTYTLDEVEKQIGI